MDITKAITHVSLCAGYGGIDLGLKRAIPNLRTVAFSEIEGFACANLVAKMEAGLLDAAPIWTNLKTFPWKDFFGKVDILSGGYPCQPFSAAGKRLGTDDPRHLWPYIADGIRIMRPKLCFFENVEGHISLGLRAVIEELGSIGYKTTWGIFSAREVGAPHQRKRVFILAYNTSLGIQGHWADWLQESRSHDGQTLPMRGGEAASNAWPSRPGEPQHEWEPPRVVQTGLANSKSVRHSGFQAKCGSVAQRGVQKVAESNQEHTSEPIGLSSVVEPPRVVGDSSIRNGEGERVSLRQRQGESGGTSWSDLQRETVGDSNSWRQSPSIDTGSSGETISGGESNIEQTECREAQPSLGRDADGTASGMDYAKLCIAGDNRTDELRLLGNGVVPATATRAFLTLFHELMELK